ncbi:MAG: hypothetical protein H8E26_09180 [FCB group bacterium]|nr:hypothetical protein [FCB group bacterium]MBL7028973.1 hypothetical protein [Candidatus Neomarinimicrobiota bacterium]MBL7121993.1 hypothetical protein [Candidatus Neomarinimicrobiota bacterium]
MYILHAYSVHILNVNTFALPKYMPTLSTMVIPCVLEDISDDQTRDDEAEQPNKDECARYVAVTVP